MADITFIQDESVEEADEGIRDVDDSDDSDGGSTLEEEHMSPADRLEKYAMSANIYNRQMVGCILLQVLRGAPQEDIVTDLSNLMTFIHKVAEDNETIVRRELVEQIPHLAMVCVESNNTAISNSVSEHLLPIVVRCLGDCDSQVRKAAQAALLVLMEHALVGRSDVEQQVCPTVLQLSRVHATEDYHTGAIALMSKMAPLLGREATERLFLQRFSKSCSSLGFYVRKVCATNIGEFCAVVGPDAFEKILLPRYIELCADEVWGVRKACAEVVMSVSCACTPELRRDKLASAFVNLLDDHSRWVRMSAFQTLGPFISTFANPRITGLAYSQAGELVLINTEGTEFRINSPAFTDNLRNLEMKSTGPLQQLFDDINAKKPDNVFHNILDEIKNQNLLEDSDDDENQIHVGNGDKSNDDCNILRNFFAQLDKDKSLSFSDISDDNTNTENKSDCNIIDTADYTNVEMELEDETQTIIHEIDESTISDSVFLETTADSDGSSQPTAEEKNAKLDIESDDRPVSESAKNAADKSCDSETKTKTKRGRSRNKNKNKSKQSSAINEETAAQQNNEDSLVALSNEMSTLDISEKQGDDLSVSPDEGGGDDLLEKTIMEVELSQSEINIDSNERLESNLPKVDNISENVDETNSTEYNTQIMNNDSSINDTSTISGDTEECLDQYNFYQFWRVSPDLPIDLSIVESDVSASSGVTISTSYLSEKSAQNEISELYSQVLMDGETYDVGFCQQVRINTTSDSAKQHIVPKLLIDHYISMTNPNIASMTDSDLCYHCAFSFPAVALTLGRDNWSVLHNTYNALAADLQWKVRRAVAVSLHELAAILGEKLATEHLAPIFDEFIKDLDEVRIGVLKHMANFFKLIHPHRRNQYLPKLSKFLTTDAELNWRFRCELADQLLLSVPLWSPRDASIHVAPLALSLLLDKIAAVRSTAILLVSDLIKHIQSDMASTTRLLYELVEQFAHSKRWVRRQTFAMVCSRLVTCRVLPPEIFDRDLMPHLTDLSWDPVANVRLAVARTIARDIMNHEYFANKTCIRHDDLQTVLKRLQADKDRDVRDAAHTAL